MRGFVAYIGATAPQVLVQITPLNWQVAWSLGRLSAAVALGPVALKVQWGEYRFAWCVGTFDERFKSFKPIKERPLFALKEADQ